MTLKTGSAVIFDLDGTLVDSLEDLADSMNAVLDDMGFSRHPLDQYRHMIGDGVTMLVRRALPEGADESAVMRGVKKMKSEYAARCARKTCLYPGVKPLLDSLTQESIPMNVLSNKMADFTKTMVDRFLGGWSFHAVVGLDEKVPRKPDPRGALRIAEKNGIPPERFVFLGDTNTDMQTARSAGMIPLGADWGFRTRKELMQSGALAVIGRPQDLLHWIEDEKTSF